MYVLALTGGIGSGKSVAAEVLKERGAVVIDLDDIAKGLLEPKMPVHAMVVDAFGRDILDADGRIDVRALADAAFASGESTRRLNAIVHPAVYAAAAGALDALALQAEPPRVVVLVVPLLAEAPAFIDLADAVLDISADEERCIERCVARGMDEDDVRRRAAQQVGDAERRSISDHVIENDASLAAFRSELNRFWDAEVSLRAS